MAEIDGAEQTLYGDSVMTRQKPEAGTKSPSVCICGHVGHLNVRFLSNNMTCCSRGDCPCSEFRSIDILNDQERKRILELGWLTNEDKTIGQSEFSLKTSSNGERK